MTTIAFRSPVTTELRRRGQCTPATDAFCVTQQFSDPDFYQSQRPNPPNPLPTHNATDIGNFRCGYPIVAMAPGTAWRVQDNATALGAATNALGIVIDHGYGVKSAYWHLASWTAGNGASVVAGQEIGKLGNTGLLATCHTHLEMSVNGVRIDPEPHMFGAPLTIGEDEPMYDPNDVLAIYGTKLRALPTANVRAEPTTASEVLANYPNGAALIYACLKVRGAAPVNRSDVWWEVRVEHSGKTRIGYVHESAAVEIPAPPPPAADCTEPVRVARAAGYADAKTKARVAVEAI